MKRYLGQLAIGCALLAWSPLCADVQELKEDFLSFKFSSISGAEEWSEIRRLRELADSQLNAESDDPEELILRARILSYHASMMGGLKALGLAKEGRRLLERSIELDPSASEGYAYVLLALLYERVPGRPVAFGSHKKAIEYYEKAIELDPTGYESNYSYAEYLRKQKKADAAKQYYRAAKDGLKEHEFAVAEKRRRIEEGESKLM